MSFVSTEFILFSCIVFLAYFSLPYRLRWIFLLVTSYFFYAYWNAGYIVLIIFSTVVDYMVARVLHDIPDSQSQRRKTLLAISLAVNLGVLFAFKYFNFFSDSIAGLLGVTPPSLDVILPVGISFYTFQSMSYTIDVYRRKIEPDNSLGIFSTYVAFFPQLVAGPIERASNMLPQFRENHDFDYDRVVSGLRWILWGFFKKVVIADRLAIYVNQVYNNSSDYTGLTLIMATVFFAFQIYCDFSGYSDIAIGTARILGFNLMTNFRQPYLSRSVREFWRRWHISLSTWFRDYVYIPLGGNRVSFGRNLFNLAVVFLLSGLWHGANWTFVIWGALHGAYVVVELIVLRYRGEHTNGILPQSLAGLLSWGSTLLLVFFAWIFFRANNVDDAFYVIAHMFDFSAGIADVAHPFGNDMLPANIEFIVSCGLIALLMWIDLLDDRGQIVENWRTRSAGMRWATYYLLGFAIALMLVYKAGTSDFIYFQF